MTDFDMRESSSYTSKFARKRRSYGMDALLLCAVTLGMGALLGPIVHSAPLMPVRHHSIVTAPFLPMGNLAGSNYVSTASTDSSGTNWDGSRWTFSRETSLSDGREYVEAEVDWKADGDYVGSEKMGGTYDPATGQLDVTGTDVLQTNSDFPGRLCRGHYTGTLTADGQLLDGYMEGAPDINGVPGNFSASRTTP